ncbi:MAG: acyl-phosphate glycerol 3-phosphate acyltransferase, partial [Chlorobiales bacterium]|nr:acyl-phosphate glycerol 3-phosphate acyltransferase [Chlorobiales bacterium]
TIAIRKYIFHVGDGIDYYINIFGSTHHIYDSLDYHLLIFGAIVSLVIVYNHRTNIQRLRLGTENRVPAFWKKNK